MNIPGHKVHHISGGYGRLVLPFFGRWLIRFFGGGEKYPALRRGMRLMDCRFHNCTVTGIH